MKMEYEDEIIKKSYNRFKKIYRYKRINSVDNSFRLERYKTCDISENGKMYRNSEYHLEFMPYKPYWFFRLKWFVKPLIMKFDEYIKVQIAKNIHLSSILKWISGIIALIASIKYILE